MGYIFLSPKKDGSAHLGYGLYGKFRGKGLMANLALVFLDSELAHLPPEVSVLLASALPENIASHRTLRSLGFTLVGEVKEDEFTYLRFLRPR
jgi:RimJ/RimL family protein N-acetyltransferase